MLVNKVEFVEAYERANLPPKQPEINPKIEKNAVQNNNIKQTKTDYRFSFVKVRRLFLF